ncbi:NACHT, LRR and PYD domains-containing protein 12-like isoform X7 [Carassius auratus]|uniref:NACHT, LRR and PYD domains-containing protein 12-like isoform X7 n=1 Tax=Carassius auratus TaxID=7957 RepID=A0A6P6K0Y1_CARAU|nr:NACHT, LRR and PYD domains-containing protein 12-like isoform X7 [Carassius auratus]
MDQTQTSGDKDLFPGISSVYQKRSEVESSCVSMKSDASMIEPMKFNSGDSQPKLSSVYQKRSEPASSCVSMKSDASMIEPMKFNSGDSQPELSSVYQKRSEPVSSCVSMKSDASMIEPMKFNSGDSQPELSSVYQKRSEPVSSCVSMKSDASMIEPMKFNSGDSQPKLSSVYQKRSEPVSSCVSMKSDASMIEPMKFNSGDLQPKLSSVHQKRSEVEPSCVSMKFNSGDSQPKLSSVHQKRSEPVSSCVSMKSDASMIEPMKFNSGDSQPELSSVHQKRSEVEPSCVSMKSDASMIEPMKFNSGDSQPKLSSVHQKRSEVEPNCVSMKSDASMIEPMKFNSGDSQPKLSSVYQNRSKVEPSCVSMKSDASMIEPMKFNSGDLQPKLSSVHQNRSEVWPRSVSMKSDASMIEPMKFNSGDSQPKLSSVHQRRSEVWPSCVFMKSDASMIEPMKFNSGDLQPKLRSLNQKRSEAESSCVSMKSDVFMIDPIKFNSGNSQLGLRHEIFNTFRSNLLKKFACLYEGTAMQGNPTLLNEIYTELYITESESGEISNEHELRQIETQSRRAATEDTAIKCSDIFRPLPGQDKAIRTVLTKGVAGIGKTVSVQKFILDWAEGKENQDVQLIFPLPFREINLMNKTLSLSDLLHVFFPETKEMEISSDEYKVLFIFDGLDECRLSLDFKSKVKLCKISESASVDELLMNLIVGNLLPSALIWITSRPAAADLIPSECVHRVTEVRGFNQPQKEEYFRKRISDQSLADRIISHLKSSRSLYIMCHIPVFCWISAAVLEKMLSPTESGEIPKTLTQMYTHFLILQTNIKHEKDYEKNVSSNDMILKLGKLAFQQLVKGNLIFYEEDLRECGIDVTEAAVYSGLCTQIFREELGLYQRKVFCFVHLSLQEHLAALYVHLSFTMKKINVFDQTKQSLLSKFLNWMKSLSELHQRAVDEALQSKNGHLDLFLRFLLGLSVESNQTLLQKLLKQTGSCSYNKEKTLEYIKQKIGENCIPEKSINLFHCLNELGDDSLMQEIQDYLKSGKIRKAQLSTSQWSALVYVLLTSEQKMDVFDVKKFSGTKHIADEVLQNLLPVVKESTSVQVCVCNLTPQSCERLFSALQSSNSVLRELDLRDSYLGDSKMKMLSDGLKSPNCQLQILRLPICNLNAQSCESLSSALQSSNSLLRELDLSNNDLRDSGVELLSHGLKSPNCQLQILRLSLCNLTDQSCESLFSALQSSNSVLRELDLSNNELKDSGVKLLSHGLKSPNCQLQILRLSGCMVTEEGCGYVSSALSSNPSHLRELDLSYNHPGDSGVKLLYEKLEDPNCSLDKFNVDHGGESRIIAGLKKYACIFTLDPNTTHTQLILSEENRNVTRVDEDQPYPDHPDRFDCLYQVLCRESVCGRCYWEIEWSGDRSVSISVSYKSISRKGDGDACWFGYNDHSWSLICSRSKYSFRHNNIQNDLSVKPIISSRIGVYVDHGAGILSFYSISDTMSLIHTVLTTFTQPLYPGFRITYTASSVKLCS